MKGFFCKPIIRTSANRVSKDGKTEVLIYYHHHKSVYFKTGIKIDPKNWNSRDNEFSNSLERKLKRSLEDQTIEYIAKIDALVENYQIKHLQKPKGDELKIAYKKGLNEPESIDILRWYKRRIETSRNKQSSKDVYIQSYQYLKQYLKATNQNIQKLEEIDITFLLEFKEWLKSRKSRKTKSYLSNITINKQINNLRYFLKQESERGKKISHDIFHLKLDKTFTRRVFLTEEETTSIINLDLGTIQESVEVKDRMNEIQDMIHFNICYGLRCSDLLELRSYHFHIDHLSNNHYLHLRVKKTTKELKLPIINDSILNMLERHLTGKQPNDRLFKKVSLATFNKYLKMLGKYAGINEMINMVIHSDGREETNLQPKWKLLSSHSLRKTSINLNLKKYDREIAKSISGHTSENGFKAYEEELTYDDLLKRMTKYNQSKYD